MNDDNTFWVKSGDLKSAFFRLEKLFSKDYFHNEEIAIHSSKFIYCEVVKDEHGVTQSATGRLAGGILGAALLGPIGAAAGLMSGGSKRIDITEVMCTLEDNRTFIVSCSQIGAANLKRLCELNKSNQHKNVSASAHLELPADSIECPECAEIIKAKAKLCRFCGTKFTNIETSSVTNSGSDAAISNSFKKFIQAYRQQVLGSEKLSDISIVEILKRFHSLSLNYSVVSPDEKYWDELKKLNKKVMKEFNVSQDEIHKLFLRIFPKEKTIEHLLTGNLPKWISRQIIEKFVENFQSVNEKNLSLTVKEKAALISQNILETNEAYLDPTYCSLCLNGLIFQMFRNRNFYIVDDMLIIVDRKN